MRRFCRRMNPYIMFWGFLSQENPDEGLDTFVPVRIFTHYAPRAFPDKSL
jgi:hypothetical protein